MPLRRTIEGLADVLGRIQGCTDAHQETQDLWVIVATEVAELTDGGSGGPWASLTAATYVAGQAATAWFLPPQVSAPWRKQTSLQGS